VTKGWWRSFRPPERANVHRVCGVHGNSSHKLSTPEVLLAQLAAEQHGVVTIAQLLATGLDRDAVAYRRKVGRLHLLHRGVYAVGHRPPSPLATAIAAVLACGPNAALSHRSAAALWRIVSKWPATTHVTAPTDRRRPGIHIHRSRHLDATTHYGVRVTTPARTLVDLADVLPAQQLARAVNEAQVQRLVTAAELSTLLTRYPGRRTSQLTPERGATRSHLEDTFTRFLKHHRLPLPERNQVIAGHEVDAVYREHKLVIELDSRQFHTTPRAFEQDRDRDADLLTAGFSTLRITDRRLKRHATHEAQRLREILSRAR
jgi:very-short-patch-repair endonuclease